MSFDSKCQAGLAGGQEALGWGRSIRWAEGLCCKLSDP